MSAYLDNSATTRPCAAAVAAMNQAAAEAWGNPSSLYRLGDPARELLRQARWSVASAMGAEPERVFFTSGGTEADNWAIFSAAQRLGKRGKHLITTAVEHHAVLHPFAQLEQQGFEVTYLPPEPDGTVTLERLRAALRPDTVLVSVMMVNNETGAVMPVQEMARLTHRNREDAIFHTDAVQGFLKVPFRARTLGADLISVSAHKVHGVKGAGALYIRQGLSLPAHQLGGGQESGLRSGTEAVPAIAAFGAACAEGAPRAAADQAQMAALLARLRDALRATPGVVLPLEPIRAAPHILSLAVPGIPSQGLINRLQDREIYVSAGSACAKGHRSHVLTAMGLDNAYVDSAIRVSLSAENTAEELDAFVAAVGEIAAAEQARRARK